MTWFKATELRLAGLVRLERNRLQDDRGYFSRIFCTEELGESGWKNPVQQINHTYTRKKGTVRGLHFQHPPYSEMKLVSVLRGEVWDVAVDIRKNSETFLQWHAELLSEHNGRALLIPEGFAHGFQSMTDDVEMLYCHSAHYKQHAEDGLHVEDMRLSIEWPLQITEISERDKGHPAVGHDFTGLGLDEL